MNDTLLISIQDIQNVSSISDNIQVESLEPFLSTSQDMYIRPLVGDALMDDMLADVATGGTQYQSLIDNYILRALAYATVFSYLPFGHMKVQKKGIVLQNSDNSQNVSVEEFSILSQRTESTMTFYLRRLKEHLDLPASKVLYPMYATTDQISPQNSSSIFLGF